MNYKQKVGYTLLGAGIMAIGITIGQFITPNIEAQSSGVFDEIQCKKLTVVDDKGKEAIILDSSEILGARAVSVYDKQGKPAVNLISSEKLGNIVVVQDKHEKPAVVLLNHESRNGIAIYDKWEKQAVFLESHEDTGNKVVVANKQGKPAAELVSDDGGNWVRVRYALQPDFPAAQLASIGIQNFVNVYNRGNDQTAAGLFSNDFTGNLVAVYDRQTGKATALDE